MKPGGKSLALILLAIGFSAFQANAQIDRIVIAAGTDEDHALQAISNEPDAQKKLAMYQDFVQKFSSNPAAVAYGNWQISQAYQGAGELDKALDYGDKALAGSPRNIDILVSQASLAQQAKSYTKLADYAAKGGQICHSIGKQPKPAEVSDEEFSKQIEEEKRSAQNDCDFLESAGFNGITQEDNPKDRMAEIEKFTAGFPDSKFGDQVSNYAMYTLGPGQLNDSARLVSFGQKILAANPNSLAALLLLANFYGEENKPGSAAKAITYAQKVLVVSKGDAPDADKSKKVSAGVAHSTIGWAYLNEEKTSGAVSELKSAAALLKGQDDQQYAKALYGLGFAYGKLNRMSEAREVLSEAVKIPGPLQQMSQDLLNKVSSSKAAKATK
jgi:tetratricopeptide (TPR) repeat protein